jgi:hypothetical protein
MRKRRVATLTAAAALTLLVGACGRRARHDDFNSIAGLRFGALANVMGVSQDTLTAEIWVRNDGRQDRFLHGGPCVSASSLRLRAAPVTGIDRGKVRWDSDSHAVAAARARQRATPFPKECMVRYAFRFWSHRSFAPATRPGPRCCRSPCDRFSAIRSRLDAIGSPRACAPHGTLVTGPPAKSTFSYQPNNECGEKIMPAFE